MEGAFLSAKGDEKNLDELLTLAGVLAFIASLFLIEGLKRLKIRDIKLERFMPAAQVTDIYEEPKKVKNSDLQLSKKILLSIIGFFLLGATAYTVTGVLYISVVVGLAGFILPSAYMKWHENAKKKLVESEFERAVEQMAVIVRSGGGIYAALERAAQNVKDPLRYELERAAAQIRLGVSSDEVFTSLAERTGIHEIEMLATVMTLQKIGLAVNLAAVLERIQDSLREKKLFREQVAAITSEGKLSARVVAILPFLTIGIIRHLMPDFVAPLFTTFEGLVTLGVSTFLIILGLVWMNNMIANIES